MFGVLLNGLVLAFYPYKPAEHEADSPHTLAIPARQSTGLPSRTISSITKLPIKREAPLVSECCWYRLIRAYQLKSAKPQSLFKKHRKREGQGVSISK